MQVALWVFTREIVGGWSNRADIRQAQVADEAVAVGEGLCEQIPRVQKHHRRRGVDSGDQIEKDRRLGAK